MDSPYLKTATTVNEKFDLHRFHLGCRTHAALLAELGNFQLLIFGFSVSGLYRNHPPLDIVCFLFLV